MGGSRCLFMPAGDCEGYGEMGRIDWLAIDVMREIQLRRLVFMLIAGLSESLSVRMKVK
jgi:hypothetical protein